MSGPIDAWAADMDKERRMTEPTPLSADRLADAMALVLSYRDKDIATEVAAHYDRMTLDAARATVPAAEPLPDGLEYIMEGDGRSIIVRTDRLGPNEYGASAIVASNVEPSFGLWAEAAWREGEAVPAADEDRERPDQRLIGQCPGCWAVHRVPTTADYECDCGERVTLIDLRAGVSPSTGEPPWPDHADMSVDERAFDYAAEKPGTDR